MRRPRSLKSSNLRAEEGAREPLAERRRVVRKGQLPTHINCSAGHAPGAAGILLAVASRPTKARVNSPISRPPRSGRVKPPSVRRVPSTRSLHAPQDALQKGGRLRGCLQSEARHERVRQGWRKQGRRSPDEATRKKSRLAKAIVNAAAPPKPTKARGSKAKTKS